MRLQGPRVVLAPVVSASAGTQMKSMEPWIQNKDRNFTIDVWGLNVHKSKKGINNANGKGKFKKGRQNNNSWNKLKPKNVALVKATSTKSKEDPEKDYGITAQICEALTSFSNGNNPPKANGGPKNDAMILAMKIRYIKKNNKIADLS